MTTILKHGTVSRDTWIRFDAADVGDEWHDDGALPPGGLLVPLAIWLKHRDALKLHPRTGVILEAGDDPALLADDVARLALIAVKFAKFTDGRGFSTGRLLRERYGFKGELRAVGHILPDQVFFLRRVGFDAFELPEARVDDAVALWQPFSEPYQGGVDQPPLFLRRVA